MNTGVDQKLSVLMVLLLACFGPACTRNNQEGQDQSSLYDFLFVPKNQADLYGTYNADYEVAKENLTINNDGTFVQQVTLKSTGKVDTFNGIWTYDSSTGYITFRESFALVLDGFGEFNPDYVNPKPGRVVLPVTQFWRTTIESSDYVSYKKTK